MSQENVEVIRRAFAVANAGDMEAMEPTAADTYHPDVEAFDLQPAPGAPEMMRGRDAIVAAGKIARSTFGYPDVAAALEAIRLAEQDAQANS